MHIDMRNFDDAHDIAAPAACSDPESFLKHINAIDRNSLQAVLDIGHAEMRGLNTNAVEMIKGTCNSMGVTVEGT